MTFSPTWLDAYAHDKNAHDTTTSILTSSAIYIHNHKPYHLPSYDRQILTTYVIHLHNNKIYHLPHDDKQITKDST